MKRLSITIPDNVLEHINFWRSKMLKHNINKSYNQCINEMLEEMVEQFNSNKKKIKRVFVVFYDDNYGSYATESRIVDSIYENKQKAEEYVMKATKDFHLQYPHLKDHHPYDMQEFDTE
jgi:metal-responsive CopG/Arc/MetJ family transcriptional regulator